ncbi:hypothetical protein N665_0130s0036 [Sinapis alba]|nr:hypothetical protein N665_0130s0036 [Sinapis alba]
MTIGSLSKEDKGKHIATDPYQAPRTARIKAQAPDFPERQQQHSLTLIGRVTNQSVQKVWSLLPFFTELWKTEHRPIGSDLGNGMFQFQFSNEADLLTVLERRPYHFAKWMLIIQRWEPTVSESFPSLIPFWIKIQGVPIHLWSEEIVRSLGEDIGIFEQAEVTALTMRMRVQVNGRLPLIKSSVLEYPNGDEVTAMFVYEKLERHCSKCFRLDHDVKDCLVAKHQNRALKEKQNDGRGHMPAMQHREEGDKPSTGTGIFRFSANNSRESGQQRNDRYRSFDRQYDGRATINDHRRSRSHHGSSQQLHSREPSGDRRRGFHSRSNYQKEAVSYRRRADYSRSPEREDDRKNFSNYPLSQRGRSPSRRVDSSASQGMASLTMRRNLAVPEQQSIPQQDFNKALEDVRDVMAQYTQCADPSESAARRERLRRAESEGQVEETAARIIASRIESQVVNLEVEDTPSAERVPAILRLGPMAPLPPPPTRFNDQTKEAPVPKKRPGRPPGKRVVPTSPNLIRGSTSRKRKVMQPKPGQARRKLNPELNTGNPKSKTGGSRESSGKSGSNSEDQPILNLLPAATRRRMDFRNPSSLVP